MLILNEVWTQVADKSRIFFISLNTFTKSRIPHKNHHNSKFNVQHKHNWHRLSHRYRGGHIDDWYCYSWQFLHDIMEIRVCGHHHCDVRTKSGYNWCNNLPVECNTTAHMYCQYASVWFCQHMAAIFTCQDHLISVIGCVINIIKYDTNWLKLM